MAGDRKEVFITPGRRPSLVPGAVDRARPDPEAHGGAVLRALERLLAGLTNGASRFLREGENPFARAGAVANTSFLVALVTGILLLFWYRASVGNAHASLEGLSFLPQLLRSLHRYSSDLCMAFVLLHGLQTLATRRFAGARWLAWTSGVLLVGLLWLDGWTGYWLVWDERAQRVALATARFLDVLPIFPDPIARSFLVDEAVNSLLFFLVFFIHMLIPMAMGIFLWVHILRVDRSKFLAGKTLTAWLLGTLVLLSVMEPALSAEPAAMQAAARDITGDHWYLGPLFVIERLSGGALWIALGLATIVFYGVPWLLPRRRVVSSVVDGARCNGCTQCWKDCPFGAISLLPAPSEGRESGFVAFIDPDRCTGCGICVGSCDSTAIDSARLPVLDVRKWVNHAADPGGTTVQTRGPGAGEGVENPCVAFVCGASAAGRLRVEADGSCAELPGFRVLPVPCAGWVHMLTVERALRHGAPGVLIVGCGQDAPCREGADTTAERLSGRRSPKLRIDQVDPARVRYLRPDSGSIRRMAREAASFRAGLHDRAVSGAVDRPLGAGARIAAAVTVAVLLAVVTWAGSDLPLPARGSDGPALVVSFKHAGRIIESGEEVDDSDVLPHMRRPRSVDRGRHSVRLSVTVDGLNVLERTYEPGGLFGDGSSIAVETLPVEPGARVVRITVADGPPHEAPAHVLADTLLFDSRTRRVVLFEGTDGFKVH